MPCHPRSHRCASAALALFLRCAGNSRGIKFPGRTLTPVHIRERVDGVIECKDFPQF